MKKHDDDEETRKKLLATLETAIPLCRSEETTCITLRSFLKQNDEIHSDDVQAISKDCGLQHVMKKEECLAFRKQCNACKKMNHCSAVCKQQATHQIDRQTDR
ncbi:hypothetical protein LSAT2_022289, partial [Lamellibrachia satsuma]